MTAAAKPNAVAAKPENKAPAKVSDELAMLEREIVKVLPSHVGQHRFMRIVATAFLSEGIAKADRKSLYQATLKCAQDGLLPDGREAVFAVFKSKDKRTGRFVDRVQYMPMVRGIIKLMDNSGRVRSTTANVVYRADDFRYWVDDAGEHITHEPNLDTPDRGALRAAYVIIKTTDGGIYTDVMTVGDIEKRRAMSKTPNAGPWVQWYEEMAQKTVFHHIAKRAPMSPEVERALRRDEEMYAFKERTERSGTEAARNVLGLVQSTENEAEDADAPEEPPAPKYDDDTALVAIASATTEDALKEIWVEIAADYFDTERELPVALEGAYGDRLESIKQASQPAAKETT